jgi:outer membrane protein assembly factor BamB
MAAPGGFGILRKIRHAAVLKAALIAAALAAVALTAAVLSGCQPAAAAAQFHGGPDRRGAYDTPTVSKPSGMLWHFATRGPVWSSPVVLDGVVYVGSDDHHLYALDAKSGAEIWQFASDGAVRSAPAIAAGQVFFTSFDGSLYALNAKTGKLNWQVDMQAGSPVVRQNYDDFSSSPLVTGGSVYAGSLNPQAGFYAVDEKSGQVQWKYTAAPEDVVRGPAAYAAGRVYFGAGANLIALDAKTGQEVFRFQTGAAVNYAPALEKESLVFGSRDGSLYAISTADAHLLWKVELDPGAWVSGSPAIADGMVFVGTAEGRSLHAVTLAEGKPVWSFQARGWIWSSPCAAGGLVFVGSYDRKVYGLDAKTGQEVWELETDGPVVSSPVIADRILYVGSGDGNLYAIR